MMSKIFRRTFVNRYYCQQKVHKKAQTLQKYIEEGEQKQSSLTPNRIVDYLDKYVIGQHEAKKAVAVSMRNRWRRKQLEQPLKQQVMPKNILISGPTGCGKTEVARRLAKLTNAPFLRVQATKFTEVGYIGKDVSSIIEDKYLINSDLAKVSLGQVKAMYDELKKNRIKNIQQQILSQLADAMLGPDWADDEIRKKKIQDLRDGKYRDLMMAVIPKQFKVGAIPLQSAPICATVQQIQYSLFQIYSDRQRIHDKDINLEKEAVRRVQQQGIVFLDQIDKLAMSDGLSSHRGISRDGVQRDLLPIIEGTVIGTKIGDISTDNILFIASGAFSVSKIDDLMPELLGRIPIQVSMKPISQEQFYRILTEPKYNLLMQQKALLKQEGINLQFTQNAIRQLARFSFEINQNKQNMGARRLQSIVQKVLQQISFEAPSYKNQTVTIDQNYVGEKLKGWDDKLILSKYLI